MSDGQVEWLLNSTYYVLFGHSMPHRVGNDTMRVEAQV